MKSVTLQDVAVAAGVTVMTISRFLRSADLVSKPTQVRIAEAISALGYVPDAHAARLAGKESAIISFVVPSLDLPYTAAVFRGLAGRAEQQNAAIMVAETAFDPERQERVIRDALAWRPTCVIYLGDTLSPLSQRMIAASSTRFVEAWDLNPDALDVSVGISNRAAAALAVQSLVAAGYRRITFAERRAGHRVERERLLGYQSAMQATGLEPVVKFTQTKGSSYAAGALLLDAVVADGPLPDAILFAGDMLAAGAIFAAANHGIVIPRNLAIAGFGDYDLAAFSSPTLSTVRIPSQDIGRMACDLGLSPTTQAGLSVPVAVQLIERQSARFPPV